MDEIYSNISCSAVRAHRDAELPKGRATIIYGRFLDRLGQSADFSARTKSVAKALIEALAALRGERLRIILLNGNERHPHDETIAMSFGEMPHASDRHVCKSDFADQAPAIALIHDPLTGNRHPGSHDVSATMAIAQPAETKVFRLIDDTKVGRKERPMRRGGRGS